MKHTKGQWGQKAYSGGDIAIYSEDENDNGYDIALVYNRKRECVPNAHLIASAPELLEALELALRIIEGENLDEQNGTEAEQMREAIKKARGE